MVRARDGKHFQSKPWRAMGDSTPAFEKDTIFQAYYGTNVSPYRVTAGAEGDLTIQQGKGITWTSRELLGRPTQYQGHWLECIASRRRDNSRLLYPCYPCYIFTGSPVFRLSTTALASCSATRPSYAPAFSGLAPVRMQWAKWSTDSSQPLSTS